MAFFGMFKSRQARQFELKTRVRQGNLRIQKFVARLTKQADEYSILARRAFDLEDHEQFRQLASGYIQCQDTIRRWERYLVRLQTLELRKSETEATQEFLSSMNAITRSILQGVKPEDVANLQTDMEAAISHSEELEETLSIALEDAVIHVEQYDSTKHLAGHGKDPVVKKETVDSAQQDRDFWAAIEERKKQLLPT